MNHNVEKYIISILLVYNCSLTWPMVITVYTIYFHLQHIGPTASERDNMVISFLTLNIISTKTVSLIAVFSISDDHCFFLYQIPYRGLPLPRNSNISLLLVFITSLQSTPYRIVWFMCIVFIIITMTLIFSQFIVFWLYAYYFVYRLFSCTDCLFSLLWWAQHFTCVCFIPVTVCDCHTEFKGYLTCLCIHKHLEMYA